VEIEGLAVTVDQHGGRGIARQQQRSDHLPMVVGPGLVWPRPARARTGYGLRDERNVRRHMPDRPAAPVDPPFLREGLEQGQLLADGLGLAQE
jgi:hypothetical protein